MTFSFARHTVLGIALSLAIGSVASADSVAVSDSGVTSVSVDTTGMDLTSPAGANALLGRLRHAASIACRDLVSGNVDLFAWSDYRACRNEALDSAIGALNAPQVAALYRDHEASASITRRRPAGEALAGELATMPSPGS